MCTILVIDDEKMILNVIEIALTTVGHKVEIAEDGKEGITKFDEGIFDLVITDLIMPKIDGSGVVRHIRNSNRKWTPIIGLSGSPSLLENIDVDSVLAKPFPIKTLLNEIADLASISATT